MSLAILCPGQGGQHPDMFRRVQADPDACALLAAATALLGDAPIDAASRPSRFDNAIAQPLVCAGALTHWLALKARLPVPAVVAGYSAGELAAHAVAGSYDAATCLQLAVHRAACMDAATPTDAGLLAVLGLERGGIEALCADYGVSIAIVNGDDHVVLGGLRADLLAVQANAEQRGARCVVLPVHVPAHTPLLAAAATGFEGRLAAAPLQAPRLPLLAGIDGRRVATPDQVRDTLARQIAQTVQWQAVMQQAVERGARVFLELGPGSALSRLARELHPQLQARSVEDFHTLEGVAEWVETACARV
ncbi:[acyl-carrier-protein] S-malonyltransferase [Stenotrophomonas maltophilia]|uniref:malonate decarboxylase subunit epsilon n=1 Tax=Stenotrophomonas chelatiphaga TaxID=517011 RepID=UPI000F4BA902|nr:malonate decarboxylase subunit epsilon [Stenotrophomonas chelatiphaga]MCS4229514.1 [acyl-carrier-protein] S-malonyltransferase [Stenotrophomonas chelatiphaga]ROQ46037.1 [acyl-carrier-protein] S-malonyltransferase [Stenotrophomonas maltophilia]